MGDNPLFDQFSRLVCFPYLALAHRVKWYGAEHVPTSGPAIIAANHQSFYDPVIVSMAVPRRVMYLAWERYVRFPVLGFLMRRFSYRVLCARADHGIMRQKARRFP